MSNIEYASLLVAAALLLVGIGFWLGMKTAARSERHDANSKALPEFQPTHHHTYRNGTDYEEMVRGVLVSGRDDPIKPGTRLVGYRSKGNNWQFRPAVEFDDPKRFQPLR